MSSSPDDGKVTAISTLQLDMDELSRRIATLDVLHTRTISRILENMDSSQRFEQKIVVGIYRVRYVQIPFHPLPPP